MKKFVAGIKRLSERHGTGPISAVLKEGFIRSYRKPRVRRILQFFFVKRLPRRMIFVVGVYNSGTTVVKDAIALHPDVCSAPIEGDRLSSAIAYFEQGGWPRAMFGNAYEIMKGRLRPTINAEQFISDLRPWVRSNKWFLEKSISNSVRVPQLRKAFPGAKFIWVMREPENVTKGIKKRSLPGPVVSKLLGSDTYPDDFLALQWAFFSRLLLNDCEGQDDFYCCRYEQFLESPVKLMGDIYKFIGVPDTQIEETEKGIAVSGRKLALHSGSAVENIESDPLTWVRNTIERVEKKLCLQD